ncbi:RNA polymerase sigma-70 factor [Belliella sp. DSM 111904]|uniref:RNA polymerase sigma-70 factor n=1 Tax=Belliella filtrata TaxID=2923435 RepID=A0ABS9UXP1_9BACT|nr:RNA polymerase sigma-70 factor [Belliella filtrata]MCH7408936.1 RNA polymerase sigma-70 factor [Belliella filtrata]
MNNDHRLPIESIDLTDDGVFEKIFKDHYQPLHSYAWSLIKDSESAEEVVQNLMMKLWEKRATVSIHVSVRSYLFRSVYHDCMNYLKHEKIKMKHREIKQREWESDPSVGMESSEGQDTELMKKLEQSLELLPAKCREVFQLSRFETLKYQEIAERLDISVKTVEAHMSKALKTLRIELADFLMLLLVIISKWN